MLPPRNLKQYGPLDKYIDRASMNALSAYVMQSGIEFDQRYFSVRDMGYGRHVSVIQPEGGVTPVESTHDFQLVPIGGLDCRILEGFIKGDYTDGAPAKVPTWGGTSLSDSPTITLPANTTALKLYAKVTGTADKGGYQRNYKYKPNAAPVIEQHTTYQNSSGDLPSGTAGNGFLLIAEVTTNATDIVEASILQVTKSSKSYEYLIGYGHTFGNDS